MSKSGLSAPVFRWLPLVIVLLCLGLAACGDSTTATSANLYATPATGFGPTGASPAAATTAASTNPNQPAPATPVPGQTIERKVIRNATLSITSDNIEQTLTQLRNLAVSQGGIVSKENTTQQGNQPFASIELQVPSQTFENTITKIRENAVKVLQQESKSQDVTEEYVDVSSQIVNLQRTEEGLQKLLDKAQKLEDVLAIQKELTSVRGEIEKRQGRIKFLDQRTTFSSISINVSLPPDVVPAKTEPKPQEGFQLDKAAGDAWNASLKVVNKGATIVVQIVVFSWWLVPFALIALAVWWMRRRSLAKNNPPSS